MISWMQKHNKYLIVTIWVATIAFIGAGFVGWGSYQYGTKAGAIGKVGDIEITQEKFDLTYQNLYNQYNEVFKGKFDEAKAKEMGLPAQAFKSLSSQAQLLNLAKQYGIVVSEKELSEYIFSIKGFQDNGVFNKSIYDRYVKSRRLKLKEFESILQDELVVQKLMKLLASKALPFETEVVASALNISDKIAYKVIKPSAIEVKLEDKDLKEYWSQFKDNYKTPRAYKLEILWTDSATTELKDDEVREFFDQNSFSYVGADGKQFTYEQAKGVAEQDFKIKKTKSKALKEYVAFKKGELKATETKELTENSSVLSDELWKEIIKAKVNDIIKPKVVGLKYATIRLISIIEPKVMSFDDAKSRVTRELTAQKKDELLEKKSKDTLADIDKEELITTNWMTMSKFDNMAPLSKQETLQFLQKLFTSSAKNGMITVSSNVVVYKIVDQKMGKIDENLSKGAENSVNQIKKSVFESNLFRSLNKQYEAQKFVKGI